MPPGATTKASDANTNWCRRVKNVRCSKASLDERVDFLLEGEVDADTDGAGAFRGGGRAFVGGLHQPGPPPVMMSQPMSASAAATRFVSS